MWSSFVVCLESQNKNFIGDSLQGRIGPAAPPPLRAVGPRLNHVFFMNLLYLPRCCETYLDFHQNVL